MPRGKAALALLAKFVQLPPLYVLIPACCKMLTAMELRAPLLQTVTTVLPLVYQ